MNSDAVLGDNSQGGIHEYKKSKNDIMCHVGCFCYFVFDCMRRAGRNSNNKLRDEESFETALDNGENLERKVVRFVAGELHPKSAWGYNVWAGEHLNFVSSEHPDIAEGDIVVVRATSIKSVFRSWIIEYEKVNNAVIDDSTISSASDN